MGERFDSPAASDTTLRIFGSKSRTITAKPAWAFLDLFVHKMAQPAAAAAPVFSIQQQWKRRGISQKTGCPVVVLTRNFFTAEQGVSCLSLLRHKKSMFKKYASGRWWQQRWCRDSNWRRQIMVVVTMVADDGAEVFKLTDTARQLWNTA